MNKISFEVLSDSECSALTGQALMILEETGVLVTLPEAVSLLVDAGGVRGTDGRIRMEPERTLELCALAPGRFNLHHRSGGALEIGAGKSWSKPGGTVSQVVKWPCGSLRKAVRRDAGDFARLCDALPRASCLVPVVEAGDVDPGSAEIISFAETLMNTTKYVCACPVKHSSAKAWVEMGRIASGRDDLSSEPCIGLLVTVLPNVQLDDDCAATAILSAREGLPLVSMGGAIAGSSAPNTVASTASLKLAAELFVVALAQCARPGAPVMVDTGATIMDMNAADIGEAGPEYILGVSAMARAARSLNLPTYCCALHTESKSGDFQAGMEKAAGMMTAAYGQPSCCEKSGKDV